MSNLLLETPKPKITLQDFREALGLVVLENPEIMDYVSDDSPSSVKSSQSAYRNVPGVIYSDQTKKSSTGEGATRKKTVKPKAVRRLLQESPTKKSVASTVKKGVPKPGTSGIKSTKKASPHFQINLSHIKIYGTNYVKCTCHLKQNSKLVRDSNASFGYHRKCKGYFQWNAMYEHNFEHEVMTINDFLLLSAKDIRVSKSTFQS